ncbi:MAG: SagB/ThcOx family dehydrogenase [Pseudanabaenaceae cyanobacterium bins.68]|nr:SagB/ThcOx family dehydrogenase [Pseudanabaenaceae cyanobacterium bins.68]
MPPISLAQHYHQRTKYDPATISAKSSGLDWSNQPSVYKHYKVGKVYDLKPALGQSDQGQSQQLSKFLLCSYGITAKIATSAQEFLYLRAAPSAGGLYPAEVYLISDGTELLPKGLYHYQPQDHTLVQFWQSDQVWQKLCLSCFQHPALKVTRLAIATSAIFYRSAWRYQARAYRRIFLDTGHLLGNIDLSGAMHGFLPYAIGGFQDEELNQLLFLESASESVTTVLAILDPNTPIPPGVWSALASATTYDYGSIGEDQLLPQLHLASQIRDLKLVAASPELDKYNLPFCPKESTIAAESINWGDRFQYLEQTILRRRSTRAYTGASIDFSSLVILLEFTYQPHNFADQGLYPRGNYFAPELLQTFLAVSNVAGLEDGCYYYSVEAEELRQIRFKNFRPDLHFLCLGQDLGRDAAVVVFHTADLEKAVASYGDRAYRYLHLDAGQLGQRINLAATYLGLGVSGIAGFFDDQVNQLLGIPEQEAVIYITTIGQPRHGF